MYVCVGVRVDGMLGPLHSSNVKDFFSLFQLTQITLMDCID